MKKIVLSSALCVASLFAAHDPSKTYSYEVTPFASGILTDSKAGVKNDHYANLGISLAKNFDTDFINQIELMYIRSDILKYLDSSKTTHVNKFLLNAIKRFDITENFAAYGFVGAGYQDVTNPILKHKDSALLNYGVGLRYDIPNYGMAIKGDVRHIYATREGQNDFMYTLGLGMPLGKKSYEPVEAKVPVVDSTPVAEPTVQEPIAQEKDWSNDDDRDGVPNHLDKCPNTSPGVKVNKDGCVETVELKINFDYNKSDVKPQYDSIIVNFANIMKQNRAFEARIEAHTDSKGSDSYNQKLSERRAASVVNALVNKGVDKYSLESVGFGESQPIASNDTEEGRAQNRRVVGYINQ